MKKFNYIVMAAMAAILITSCEKEEGMTVNDSNSDKSLAVNSNKALGGGYGFDMDTDASSTEPACNTGGGVCIEVVVVGATLDGLITATPNNLDSYLTQTVIEELSNGDATVSDYLTMVKNGQKSMTVVEFPNSSTTRSGFLIGDNGGTLSIENSDLQLVVNK
jgi:hypothetical protein